MFSEYIVLENDAPTDMPPLQETCNVRIYKADRDELMRRLYRLLAATAEKLTLADVVAALVKKDE